MIDDDVMAIFSSSCSGMMVIVKIIIFRDLLMQGTEGEELHQEGRDLHQENQNHRTNCVLLYPRDTLNVSLHGARHQASGKASGAFVNGF